MTDLKYDKNVQLVNYFANKAGGTINRMKMLKLVWLSDRLHLLRYGRTVSKDYYVAMENGPVASQIKDIALYDVTGNILPSGKYDLKSASEVDLRFLSKSDLEALETVWERFGNDDQFTLSEMSHKYPEWKKFEDYLKTHKSHDMDFFDFFLPPIDKSPITKADFFDLDEKQVLMAKQIFQESQDFVNSMELLNKACGSN